MIRKLIHVQIQDPGRGSFMVKTKPVTTGGKPKKKHGKPVYVSCNGHPDAYEFISVP